MNISDLCPESIQYLVDFLQTQLKQALQDRLENQSLKKECDALQKNCAAEKIRNEQLQKRIVFLTKRKKNLKTLVMQMKNKKGPKAYTISDVTRRAHRSDQSSSRQQTLRQDHTSSWDKDHTPSWDKDHTLLENQDHTPPRDKDNSTSLLHNCETTIVLFPSPSSSSTASEDAIAISEDSIPAQPSQGLLGGVAVPQGRKPLQLITSPSKSHVRYMEARPRQDGHDQSRTHISNMTSHDSTLCGGGGSTLVTCLPCDVSTKVIQMCDQTTCDVTCLACDVQDTSSVLLVVKEQQYPEQYPEAAGGLQHLEEVCSEEYSSASDKLSPPLFSGKQLTEFPPPVPHHPPIIRDLASAGLGTLVSSPLQYIPKGIPPSDSQHSLLDEDLFTQPPSPPIISRGHPSPPVINRGPPSPPIISKEALILFKPELEGNCVGHSKPPSLRTDSGAESNVSRPDQQGGHVERPTELISNHTPLPLGVAQSNRSECTPDQRRRRKRRRRGLKQTTLTQVLPDGSLGLATPTIVAVTPGVRPVKAILSGPSSGLFMRTDIVAPLAPGGHQEVDLSAGERLQNDDVTSGNPVDDVTSGNSDDDDDITRGKGSQQEQLCEGEEPGGEESLEGEEPLVYEGDKPILHEGEELPDAECDEDLDNTLVEDEDKNVLVESARKLAKRAGLPSYKFVMPVLKKSDRDKLDGKPCPNCQKWFADGGGIHRDQREHLRHVCRHKHLYHPPDTDPRLWDISFPNTEECERIMGNKS